MDKSISDIISSLSQDDIDNLKQAAQSIFGENESENSHSDKPDLSGVDPHLLGKITKVMSMMNKKDSRVELISALKPFLSSDRQARADEAMKIIRLIELIPLLKDQG